MKFGNNAQYIYINVSGTSNKREVCHFLVVDRATSMEGYRVEMKLCRAKPILFFSFYEFTANYDPR